MNLERIEKQSLKQAKYQFPGCRFGKKNKKSKQKYHQEFAAIYELQEEDLNSVQYQEIEDEERKNAENSRNDNNFRVKNEQIGIASQASESVVSAPIKPNLTERIIIAEDQLHNMQVIKQ